MRKTAFYFSLVYALVTSACSSDKHDAAYFDGKLDSLDRNLKRGIIDTALVASLSKDIYAYTKENSSDTASPKLMFNLARLQQNHRMYDNSIGTLRALRERFPNSPYASRALMMEGFTHANITNRYDEARKAYNEYLERYRDVDTNMTRSAELELLNMGKSPEAMMREFEARRKGDSLERIVQ